MSTDLNHDDCMSDDEELIGLWNDGLITEHVGMSLPLTLDDVDDVCSSDYHVGVTMVLSMTEVDMESDYSDDSLSLMSDQDMNVDAIDTRSWSPLKGHHLFVARKYRERIPSFYGDDDDDSDDDDYESGDEYFDRSDDEQSDDISISHVSIHTPHDDPYDNMFPIDILHREVTPEPTMAMCLPKLSSPNQQMSDVQMQVHRTMQKLACSMRRSNTTRTLLKRQRLHFDYADATLTKDNEDDKDEDVQEVNVDDTSVNNSIKCSAVNTESSRCDDQHVAVDEGRRQVYQMVQMGLPASTMD